MARMKPLNITEEEQEKTRQEIINHLITVDGFTQEKAEKKAEKVIGDSIKGWPSAPKSFQKRVSFKMGRKSSYNTVVAKEHEPNVIEERKKLSVALSDICQQYNFSKQEKDRIKKELIDFADSFDFNNPADFGLLRQYIVSSIILSRMQVKLMEDENHTDNKLINAIAKYNSEIIKLQEALGITRSMRQEDLHKDEDVASIAKSLQSKLDQLEEEEIKQLEEELRYDRERLSRPPVNAPKTIEQKISILESSSGIDDDTKELIQHKQEQLARMTFNEKEKAEEHNVEIPVGRKV